MELTTYHVRDDEFNINGYIRPRNPNFLPTKEDLGKCVDIILTRYYLPSHRIADIRQRMIDTFHALISYDLSR